MPRCPLCRRLVAPRAENPAFPFCCDRCKLQDLGKWLGEGYRVPGEPAGDGPPPVASGDDEGEGDGG